MKCRFDCYIHIGRISSCSQNPDTFGTIICDLRWKGWTARIQCTLSNPSLQCCRRWKVDTKETTISSILVARSNEGYQENRLGTRSDFFIHIGKISSCSQNSDTFGTIICDLEWKGWTPRVQCTLSNVSFRQFYPNSRSRSIKSTDFKSRFVS